MAEGTGGATAGTSSSAGTALAWLRTALRVGLGGVLLVAGLLKLPDPAAAERAVRAYQLLPEALVPAVAFGLPMLEIVLGLLLVLGVAVRAAALGSGVLLVVFLAGIGSAWGRGLQIDCGCFGGGGEVEDPQYLTEVLRDVGLLVAAGVLVRWPQTPAALFTGARPSPTDDDPDPAQRPGRSPDRRALARRRVAQKRAAQALARDRRRWQQVTAAVALGVVVLVVGGITVQSARLDQPETVAVPGNLVDDAAVEIGSGSRVIDVYEDFLCPVCGQFEAAAGDTLAELVATGEARVRYHPIAILDRLSPDAYSTRAANAAAVVADTAGPEVFLAFHGLLFEGQPAEGGPGLTDDELVALAVQAGAEESEVRAGIEDERFADWVAQNTVRASRAGINSTPTVLLDGRLLTDRSPEGIRTAVLG